MSRNLEKRIELKPDGQLIELSNPMELEYYLIETDENDMDELKGKLTYGIEIVKRISENNIENKIVKNFSCCKENTRLLLNKLAENTVTPVGLQFVLDDLIGT